MASPWVAFLLALALPHAAFAAQPRARSPKPPAAAPATPSGPAAGATAPKSLSDTLEGVAKAEYEAGRVLFGVNNFEGAFIKFQRAHELSSDPRLLWNMAACEKGLAHYASMLALLETYRASPSPLIGDVDGADAAKLIELTKAFVSALRVEVSEPGAHVFVDGREAGTTPIAAPVLVDIGRREVRVAKEGFREHREALVVRGAEPVTLRVRLEPEVHRGRLVLDAGQRDRLEIDGREVGVWHWEGSLPSGPHRVRVSASGMRSYDTEVIVQDGEVRRLRAALEPASSGVGPWPWVVGGVLAAGGLAIAGYLLFKPEDKYAPPLVGNLPPGSVYQP